LADLQTGQVTAVGKWGPADGRSRIVADDGTVLAIGDQVDELRLVGPSQAGPFRVLTAAQIVLAPNARTLLYLHPLSTSVEEIRAVDIKTGSDISLGPGESPNFARDGRRFSYLRTEGDAPLRWFADTQVWIGDAIDGTVRKLSNEHEGINSQSITADGTTVIATTRTGRLLSIDTVTGIAKEILASPGPERFFVPAVRGSYNEVVGDFRNAPEIAFDNTSGFILGRSPRGFAFQVPWDAQAFRVIFRGDEPAWERLLAGWVGEGFAPTVLPIGSSGPKPPSGAMYEFGAFTSYAIHEDWSGAIDEANPARPGEVIHMYASGFGPVDGQIPTGVPTPTDRLYRITLPCDWRATGASRDPLGSGSSFEVPFVGLAPGLVGLYQLDFRIPPEWKESTFDAFCVTPYGVPSFAVQTAPVPVQQN
jgi:uncharacterized protein (TIGR03437 family)